MIILFKYCANVEKCESFGYIYIYRERERERERGGLH